MSTITRFTKENEIKENFKVTWSLKEDKGVYSCRTTKYIVIYINDKEVLFSKPLSIKTTEEINKTIYFRKVMYILCRERKFCKEDRKIVDLIKNIIKY